MGEYISPGVLFYGDSFQIGGGGGKLPLSMLHIHGLLCSPIHTVNNRPAPVYPELASVSTNADDGIYCTEAKSPPGGGRGGGIQSIALSNR